MTPETQIIRCVMPNVDKRIVDAQTRVLHKLMPSDFTLHTVVPLGGWSTSGESHARMLNRGLRARADVHILMDVDCIPLSARLLEDARDIAAGGWLFGHASFSAHIGDGTHRFVGPDFLAISDNTYTALGRPSLVPTPRGDVAEELTWRAEELDVDVLRLLAQRCDEPAPWSGDTKFGFGTWFGHGPRKLTSYHMYGAREATEARIRRFVKICDEVISHHEP